ncbi:MAG: ABC transporter substrate-binding protein [Deltaproteobacteria bacterium]|nr:ABC transporter substrate-binding protein [Deltaproteobacteria bacterium]
MLRSILAVLAAMAVAGCRGEAAKPAAPVASPEAARPAAPALRKLKVAIAIPSYVHAVAWIAKSKGFFEKRGIDAEVVTTGGSADAMKGLLSNDIGIALAGGDSAVKANLAGADLVVFGTVVNRHYHRLVVRQGIDGPEDLRGKSLGVPVLGGPQDFLTYVLCRKWGLEYGKDVAIKVLGKEIARLPAVQRGDVDGLTAAAPRSTVEKLGLKILADPRTWDEPAPYMMMVARRPFLKDNDALVADFVRAIADAEAFYMTNPDEALAVAFDKLGPGEGDPRENYAEGGPLMFAVPPAPDVAAMRVAVDYIATAPDLAEKARAFDLPGMIDGALVARLAAEGAFGQVAAARAELAARLKPPTGEAAAAGAPAPAAAAPGR